MILYNFPQMVNTVINVGIVWWPRRYDSKWELADCGNGCLEFPEGYGSECSECLKSIAVSVQST